MPATTPRATSWMAENDCELERSPKTVLSKGIAKRTKTSHGSTQSEIHHKRIVHEARIAPGNQTARLRNLIARLGPREETMPQAAESAFFFVAPRKVAILTVKFLWQNFQRAENTDKRRRNEFSSHLRVLDV